MAKRDTDPSTVRVEMVVAAAAAVAPVMVRLEEVLVVVGLGSRGAVSEVLVTGRIPLGVAGTIQSAAEVVVAGSRQ